MVSTNTKMYNLRWALATPSDDDDDKNSKLYKYSVHVCVCVDIGSGGDGQRTFSVRFLQGLQTTKTKTSGYGGAMMMIGVHWEKTMTESLFSSMHCLWSGMGWWYEPLIFYIDRYSVKDTHFWVRPRHRCWKRRSRACHCCRWLLFYPWGRIANNRTHKKCNREVAQNT